MINNNSKKSYESYEEAVEDYLNRFRALRDATFAKSSANTRGAGNFPVDTMIERANEIADISANIVMLAESYLDTQDLILHEGISGQLLSQAAAELQLATGLLQIATTEKAGTSAPSARVYRGTIHTGSLLEVIDEMEKAMAVPVSAGLVMSKKILRTSNTAVTPEDSKKALQRAANTITSAISQRVIEFGGNVALNLVLETEWSAVSNGIGLLGKEISKILEAVKQGLGTLLVKAVEVASKTLLNVYEKIRILLGKDAEGKIRKQIQEWLEKIKDVGEIDLFDHLIKKLYDLDSFKKDLKDWLEETNTNKEMIDKTTQEVIVLGDKFAVLISRMSLVHNVIGLAKLVKIPQILAIIAGIQVGLLGVVVYSGHDYIGYKRIRILNLTKGITEVIKENLF